MGIRMSYDLIITGFTTACRSLRLQLHGLSDPDNVSIEIIKKKGFQNIFSVRFPLFGEFVYK
jgi:hypothetical protein